MRKQHTKKLVAAPARKIRKRIVRVARKQPQSKWSQAAQMPDYLAEEHPELCNS